MIFSLLDGYFRAFTVSRTTSFEQWKLEKLVPPSCPSLTSFSNFGSALRSHFLSAEVSQQRAAKFRQFAFILCLCLVFSTLFRRFSIFFLCCKIVLKMCGTFPRTKFRNFGLTLNFLRKILLWDKARLDSKF